MANHEEKYVFTKRALEFLVGMYISLFLISACVVAKHEVYRNYINPPEISREFRRDCQHSDSSRCKDMKLKVDNIIHSMDKNDTLLMICGPLYGGLASLGLGEYIRRRKRM
ncbi:MAG: hypothetical protein ABIA21_03450 [Candidatus Aenigmatarchaeota archaeon]